MWNMGRVLGQMGRGRQARSYRRYVESALAETDEEFKGMLQERAIGDEHFCARVRDAWQDLARKAARMEDVEFRRAAPRLAGREVLETVARRAHAMQDKDSLRLKAAIECDLQSQIDVLKCN